MKRFWIPLVLLMFTLTTAFADPFPTSGWNIPFEEDVPGIVAHYADSVSQRASLSIEWRKNSPALVSIEWASSADKSVIWTFSGELNPETGILFFSDCVKETDLYANGAVTRNVEYENGVGSLTAHDGCIFWQDATEDAGKDCVFVFTYAEPAAQSVDVNLAGRYQDSIGQRADMVIEYAGPGVARVTIQWADSAEENVVWTFTGEWDMATNTLSYTDGAKVIEVYSDSGVNRETAYENGSGMLSLRNDGIHWQDDVENAGETCLFLLVD